MKVSFKEENGRPFKRVERNGTKTTVFLTGRLKGLPDIIPADIARWVWEQPYVEIIDNVLFQEYIIKSVGKAVKSDADEDDPVVAERVAESKAKLNIYRFMREFTGRLCRHYIKLLTGSSKYGNLTVSKDGLMGHYSKYNLLALSEVTHLNCLIDETWA